MDTEMLWQVIWRVIGQKFVEEGGYRYVLVELPGRAEVRRIPLSELETNAVDGWETIATVQTTNQGLAF